MPTSTSTISELEGLEIPDDDVDSEEAKQYLIKFIDWTNDLLLYLACAAVEPSGECNEAFEELQIEFLEKALQEITQSGQFIKKHIDDTRTTAIQDHGLYGVQLRWKISNIRFWFDRVKENPDDAKLWDRLLQSIISLLNSLIGATGYGAAFNEAIEAVKNAIALFSKKAQTE